MSEKTKTAEVAESEGNKAGRSLEKNRRYIGSRETRAYILYDIAQSFNIDARMEYFTNDILVIAFRWQTIISGIVGVWDIINDLFLASLVDRTNTRFGKFKPYLIRRTRRSYGHYILVNAFDLSRSACGVSAKNIVVFYS